MKYLELVWFPIKYVQGLIDYYTMVISRDSETILFFGGIFKHIQYDHSNFSKSVWASLRLIHARLINQYAITMPFKAF